ncbi:MAG: PBS lyase, partial [Myxococcota bacterium]|nr:PBS lyase [Myxococcota bacterium]
VPQLEQAAGDPDGQVASHAIRALVRLQALGPELLWTASRHADPEVVKEVLAGAASLVEGERLALSLLADPRWDVRAAAARALGSAGTGSLGSAGSSAGSGSALAQVRAALNTEADPLVRQCLAETARVLGRR